MDEATSALDEMSQSLISSAIDSMSCTTIIVAHRMSTIESCEKILVLNNGQVEFFGKLSSAKKKSSTYKKMLEESNKKEKLKIS